MMKNSARIRFLNKSILPCSGYFLILLFLGSCTVQNSPSLLSAQAPGASNMQKVLDAVPFAYDVAVDTISYNSCVGSNLNAGDNIHGIKLGANEGFVDNSGTGAVKAGIKLKSDFLSYLAKNLSPNYPNTSISPSQIQYILQNSTANRDLQIQYAVRTLSNLHVVPDLIDKSKQPAITPGRDGVYQNSLLNVDPVLTAITKDVKFGAGGTVLAEGPRTYNLGSKSSPEPLQGSLGYSSAADETYPPVDKVDDGTGYGEQYSDDVRARFNSINYVLAVTFGNPQIVTSSDNTTSMGLNSLRRPSETDLKKAYGKGYELSFISKNSGIPSWRRNILNRVTEKDLSTGQLVSGASWTCDNFVIVKQNQLNNKKADEPACSELIGSDLENAGVAAKVKLIRRHYSEDKWAIGFFYERNTVYEPAKRVYFDPLAAVKVPRPLCLVSKATDCYLPTTGLTATTGEDVGVQYDPTKECYLSRAPQMGVTYVGGLTGDTARRLGRCAQFASICSRASTSY